MEELNIHIASKDGITILKPSGKLILDAVSELRQAIDAELLASGEDPKLIVDFGDVSMIGSSGLGILMQVHVSMIRNGVRLATINTNSTIQHLLVRSRLITTFEHFDSESEALSSLASPNI